MWLRRCIGAVVARSPLRDGASRGTGCQGRFAALRARTSSTLDTHHLGQGRTQLRGSALTCEQHQGIPFARVVPAGCSAIPLIPSARVAPVTDVTPSGPTEVAEPCPGTGFPVSVGSVGLGGGPCWRSWRGSVGCRLVGPMPVYWALSVEQPAIGGRRARSDAGSLDRCRSTGRYRPSRPLSAGRFTGWSTWWCARSARWFGRGCPGRPALSNLPARHRNLPAGRRRRRGAAPAGALAGGC